MFSIARMNVEISGKNLAAAIGRVEIVGKKLATAIGRATIGQNIR